MTSRGDRLAQADGYLEPEGADFSYRTWVNEKTSRTTQIEKSKRGGDVENLSKPVTTINCETSATSADNWEFFGEVESKYSQMDSMTYELSGGASGSGLVTLGDFTERVDGPFGGNWRLPVSPLAVGVTNLWVRGKNLKEKWGDRAFKSFTRSPTGAPAPQGFQFDEFNVPSVMPTPIWTPLTGLCPVTRGSQGLPPSPLCFVDGVGNSISGGFLQQFCQDGSAVGISVYQDFADGFDAYVKVTLNPGGGGGTDGAGYTIMVEDYLQPLYFYSIQYVWNQGSGMFDLFGRTRDAAGAYHSHSWASIDGTGNIYLRMRHRDADLPSQPRIYSSTDEIAWTDRSGFLTKSDLRILDKSQLRFSITTENNDAGDSTNSLTDFLRDGSGIP